MFINGVLYHDEYYEFHWMDGNVMRKYVWELNIVCKVGGAF